MTDTQARHAVCEAMGISRAQTNDYMLECVRILVAEHKTMKGQLANRGTCAKCRLPVRIVDGIIEDERGLLHLGCALVLRVASLEQTIARLTTEGRTD